jgi:hypothetical protein
LEFENIFRKTIRGIVGTPHGLNRKLICSWCPSKTQIHATWKHALKSSELLSDDIRRVVREHNASRGKTNPARGRTDMRKHQRSRCTGDRSRIVMLRDPDPWITQVLQMNSEIA